MSVVILKFYSSDPKRSFLYSFYPRYLLFLSCNAAVTIHALSMLYRRFIHALYDLQLKEINFIKNPSIPFLSSIPIVHFRTLRFVSGRAITHVVSSAWILSCYSRSLHHALWLDQ